MLTAAEVVLAPWLSVAFAVSVCVPAARLTRATLYGATVAVPASVPPSKKSTLATQPLLSEALAVTETLAGAVKLALLAGEVMLTAGGAFGGGGGGGGLPHLGDTVSDVADGVAYG